MRRKNEKKNKMTKEIYYICPKCKELSTETELLRACSNGGMPYCYCEFDNDRIFIGYKRISKKQWKILKEQRGKKVKLLK